MEKGVLHKILGWVIVVLAIPLSMGIIINSNSIELYSDDSIINNIMYINQTSNNLNVQPFFNNKESRVNLNISLNNEKILIDLIEDADLKQRMNLSNDIKILKGSVYGKNNSEVNLIVTSRGYFSGYIDIDNYHYRIGTNMSIFLNRSKENNLLKINPYYMDIQDIKSIINRTENKGSTQSLIFNNTMTKSESDSEETDTLNPGYETESIYNEIFYICRIGFLWNTNWQAVYGSESIATAYAIMMDVEYYYKIQLNIKFYYNYWGVIPESINFNYITSGSALGDFHNWIISQDWFDWDNDINNIININKIDRAVFFCIPPGESYWGNIIGESNGRSSLVGNFIQYMDHQDMVQNTGHELGHCFKAQHTWSSSPPLTFMASGLDDNNNYAYAFTESNKLAVIAEACGLRWRQEFYNGYGYQDISPQNIRLLEFYVYYVLAPSGENYIKTYSHIRNVGTETIYLTRVFFGCRYYYSFSNVDFGYDWNIALDPQEDYYCSKTQTFEHSAYEIWPAYGYMENNEEKWGPFMWNYAIAPIFCSRCESHQGPYVVDQWIYMGETVQVYYGYFDCYTQNEAYLPMLFEYEISINREDILDITVNEGLYVECQDPEENYHNFGHTQMRIQDDHKIINWFILENIDGEWNLRVNYYRPLIYGQEQGDNPKFIGGIYVPINIYVPS